MAIADYFLTAGARRYLLAEIKRSDVYPNMVSNPGAESGTTGWGSASIATGSYLDTPIAVDAGIFSAGAASFRGGAPDNVYTHLAIPVTPGKTYTVKYKSRGSTATAGAQYAIVGLRATAPVSGLIRIGTADTWDFFNFLSFNYPFNDTFTQQSFTWVCPPGANWASLFIYNVGAGPANFYWDEVEFREQGGTIYRIADQPYTTEPGDNPSNCPYSPIIAALPELSRKLPDFFSGGASTGFGTLALATREAMHTHGPQPGVEAMTLPRGAEVTLKLAAPRDLFPFTDALTLAKGKVARVGGSSDGSLSVEVTDGSDEIARAVIPVTTKPLAWGKVRNAAPFLTTPASLIYTLHDGPIQAVDAVYDDGVLISPANYTVNLTNATVTLANTPAGQITCDFQGHKTGGTYLSSTEQIIGNLLDRAGFTTLTRTFTALPSGVIGLYLTQTTNLAEIITALMRGCAGYWFISNAGAFKAAQFPIPGTPGDVYAENELLEEVSYSDDDRLHKEIRYAYQRNWTQYQSRAGASTGQADFSPRQWYEGAAVDGAPLAEYVYQTSPILETYFDTNGDASAAATRYLNIFRQPRTVLTGVVVPFLYTRELGDAITVEFDGLAFDGIVTGIASKFDGDYPVQVLEVFA